MVHRTHFTAGKDYFNFNACFRFDPVFILDPEVLDLQCRSSISRYTSAACVGYTVVACVG
jgi:hypothetical protein